MPTLLHISDLHFGRPYLPRAGEAVVGLAQQLHPDALVCSGDIVQWAEDERAWRAARDFLHRFGAPLICCPGNHDIARIDLLSRALSPYARYHQYIHPQRDVVLRIPGASIVSLGTPRRWTPELGHVSEAQLDWAERELERRDPGALRAVVLHHGLLQRGMRLRRDFVRGRDRAVQRFDAMGVELVMSGHNHHPWVERVGDPTSGPIWSQAGTATARRYHLFELRKCSVSVVRTSPSELSVEWWTLEPNGDAFARSATHRFGRVSASSSSARAAG